MSHKGINFERNGVRMHTVIQDDSLGMAAAKLDTGEWAEAGCEDARDYLPLVGRDVLVIEDDGQLYWIGIFNS